MVSAALISSHGTPADLRTVYIDDDDKRATGQYTREEQEA